MLKTQLLGEDERKKCVARVNYSAFELLLIFLPVLSLPAVFCLCRKVSYLTPLLLLLAQFFLYSTPTTGAAFAATNCVRLIIAENFKKKTRSNFFPHPPTCLLFCFGHNDRLRVQHLCKDQSEKESSRSFVLIDVS